MRRETYIHIWLCLITSIYMSMALGCDQSASKQTAHRQYDMTRHTYHGNNIIQNGNFNEGLLHWNVPTADYGDYVEVITENTSQRSNHVAAIHSLDETVEGMKRFYISSLPQAFTIQPGDFQTITIKARVKSNGGAIPSLLVEFYEMSKEHNENANYGVLERFRENHLQTVDGWSVIELSRAVPAKTDRVGIWCTGVPIDDNSSSIIHATEPFEIYFDDVEAILEFESE